MDHAMDHVIHAHRTVCIHIHIVACVHANIARIVTHAVWYAFQRFDSATSAIVDTGNVATTNQPTSQHTDVHKTPAPNTPTHSPEHIYC